MERPIGMLQQFSIAGLLNVFSLQVHEIERDLAKNKIVAAELS